MARFPSSRIDAQGSFVVFFLSLIGIGTQIAGEVKNGRFKSFLSHIAVRFHCELRKAINSIGVYEQMRGKKLRMKRFFSELF